MPSHLDRGATALARAEDEPLYVDVSVTRVPEAAAWALMILGFGVAGALRRARRRAPEPV